MSSIDHPAPASPLPEGLFSDAHFWEPRPRSFRYANADTALATVLAQRITRHHNDLTAHVQRIHFHAEYGKPDQLAGALADLFMALGDRGRDLKLRMLDLASSQLDDVWLSFLYDHLDSGLDVTTPLPDTRHSRLTAAVTGSFALVVRNAGTTATLSQVEEARELLDSGAIDAARQLLEAALLADPERPELHQELLVIYRHTHDRSHLERMAAQLAPLPPELHQAWQAVRETLLDDDNAANTVL